MGNLLFLAFALTMTIPVQRQFYRPFGTWRAPTIAIAVFALAAIATSIAIDPDLRP